MKTTHLNEAHLEAAYNRAFIKGSGTKSESFRAALGELPDPPPSPPVLKPITEPMPDVAEGCSRIFWGSSNGDGQVYDPSHNRTDEDTHFLDIALPAPVDTVRQEFEAAVKLAYPNSWLALLPKDKDGVYSHEHTYSAWIIFKAARNSKPAHP